MNPDVSTISFAVVPDVRVKTAVVIFHSRGQDKNVFYMGARNRGCKPAFPVRTNSNRPVIWANLAFQTCLRDNQGIGVGAETAFKHTGFAAHLSPDAVG